ncbi:hypothetical protein AVEN_101363-1 [Araneus ventricosus]|uniref:Endonuclease/exonuclease/phosphatase domain-containing protein n=1 Tax=Araneus ventricosus TaxID=182803 RepID=A0A4Y2SNT7_ARAVE|nr:hypothetical protein AVEN_101363-1 [Araneus ventricosus]
MKKHLQVINHLKINLQRAKIATTMLLKAAQQHQPDLFIVQEPHVTDGKIAGIPKCWKSCFSKSEKPGIIAFPAWSTPVFLSAKGNTMAINPLIPKAIDIKGPQTTGTEVLEELTDLTTNIIGEEYLTGGVLKSHSQRWGNRDEDSRGKQLQEFIAEKHIFLINSSESPPTFEHSNRQGSPDLTMVSSHFLAAICEWKVLEEETYSDHKFVKICINSNISTFSFARFKMAHGGHCKFVNLFKSTLNLFTSRLYKTLFPIVLMKKSSMKQPEPFNLKSTKLANKFIKLNVTPDSKRNLVEYRSPNKEVELKAIARRLQKSRGEDRITYTIVLSEEVLCSRKQSKEPNVDLGDCYAPRHKLPTELLSGQH